MDGIHDLGGMQGFGPVRADHDEPPFHETWEGRVYGMVLAAGAHGLFGTPRLRHAIERIPPARYLASSYYERWMTALASLLVERGTLESSDIGEGFPLAGPSRVPDAGPPGPDNADARFTLGDRVRVRDVRTSRHTRCPSYLRGRCGTVVRYDGPSNFDDVEAHADGPRREPLYSVAFDGAELWGEGAEPDTVVAVDLFDAYLEPA